MTRRELLEFFQLSLSRPPCFPGRRLLSELELSRVLGAGRQQIRGILDELETQGFITRKQGSGTFVRKLYPYTPRLGEESLFKAIRLLPEMLFQEGTSPSVTPDQQAQQLRIGISGAFALRTSVNYRIFQGALQRLEELGCKAVTAVATGEEQFLLPAEPCDGYLCDAVHASQLRQQLSMRQGDSGVLVPVSYFHCGYLELLEEPLVILDTYEAVQRCMRILFQRGFRRIAFIGGEVLTCRRKPVQIYLDALTEYNEYEYRGMLMLDMNSDHRDQQTREWLLELLQRNKPEVLLIHDDHILPVVQQVCGELQLVMGEDVGVCAITNRGCGPAEAGVQWSGLKFDPGWLGRQAVDNLLAAIRQPGVPIPSISQHAAWVEGATLGAPRK